jgi:hypothetical protein
VQSGVHKLRQSKAGLRPDILVRTHLQDRAQECLTLLTKTVLHHPAGFAELVAAAMVAQQLLDGLDLQAACTVAWMRGAVLQPEG